MAIEAFAVSGANTVSPFDPNPSLIKSTYWQGDPGYPSITGISTTNAKDFIWVANGRGDFESRNPITLNSVQMTAFDNSAYIIVSSVQSSVSAAFSYSPNSQLIIADAVESR